MTEGISPEEAKVLADKLVESEVIPKKIPATDDVDGQVKAVGGALASALLTATEMPLHVLQPWVADLASQLVALGIRQTEHVDPSAVHAPAWITDGVRQESIKLPEQPQHTEADPHVEMTATAPKCPKRIPKASRAVRR
ncbi:hypothetical protein [Mycobacteroides chelonae]|uniref:hypothetical protein n=1 Tax=Mycobacteroides chelonae TaxID=1774 RepID=UPI001E516DBE|nr:hypothetical protein [Mycobacteroides chelonae]